MYMITIVQSEAYKATGDPKYINRAAKEMVLYLDELQHPNGLFLSCTGCALLLGTW